VLSPLLFIIVLEELREGMPLEFMYADDLVLISLVLT